MHPVVIGCDNLYRLGFALLIGSGIDDLYSIGPVPPLRIAGVALFALFSLGPPQVDAAEQFPALQKLLGDHCLACHGADDNIEAGVDLRVLNSEVSIEAHAKLLLKVRKVVSELVMPPNKDELPDHVRSQMTEKIKNVLSRILATYPFEPIPIRRMNRFQYNNAVVDLLELDRDIFQLNERLLRRREDYFQPHTERCPHRSGCPVAP